MTELNQEMIFPDKQSLNLDRMVNVMIFGEGETAAITVRPDTLDLKEIPLNVTISRVLLLTNLSSRQPIIYRYKKVCYIEIEPKEDTLRPSNNLEVLVKIRATKLGKVFTKIAFDLLFYNQPKEEDDYSTVIGYIEMPVSFEVLPTTSVVKPKFNMGITPQYIKEVGFATDDIKFGTLISFPKATLLDGVNTKVLYPNDLIAFPNDRPQSLRPYNSSAM